MAKSQLQKTPVTQEQIDQCLAKAVAEGDIVNFKFLFVAYSPLRTWSSEDLMNPKYDYLRPSTAPDQWFQEALALAATPHVRAHVKSQLEKKGPAQLPSELVLLLADNAVRLGKYTTAAQAYELLRVRRRMQDEYFNNGDAALGAGDIPRAVRAYRIATGLEYDYAAFPEPLPQVPSYQTKALILHAEYPHKPEDAVALQAIEQHLKTALAYLLLSGEAAARLYDRPVEQQLDIVAELVHQADPQWSAFTKRYLEACALVREMGESLQRESSRTGDAGSLADEIEQQQLEDPRRIPAKLLGREIPGGEWWQYLKDLAYQHPAAALFVSRQAVSKELEIIMPRYLSGSRLVARLGLDCEAASLR